MTVDISMEFCGVKFQNPFTLAASPCTDSPDMLDRAFDAGWGGAVIKTLALDHEPVHLTYPMMHSHKFADNRLIGLENIDLISDRPIDVWLKAIPKLKKKYPKSIIIASCMASKKEDWQEAVKKLQGAGADMLEFSFSCPHGMPERGMGAVIGQNPEYTKRTCEWIAEVAKIPTIIKLTPQITDITFSARAVLEGGCSAVCLINSVKGLLGVDLDTFTPYPQVNGKGTYGGYTGPAVKPIALKCVTEVAKAVKIPISAVGGVSNWHDALEFISLGAENVQLCTAPMMYGFGIVEDLIDGTKNYLAQKGFKKLRDIVGKALPNVTEHHHLEKFRYNMTINHDNCIGCGRCYTACYDGGHQAIKFGSDRKPAIDKEKCVGCGFCESVCPIPETMKVKKVEGEKPIHSKAEEIKLMKKSAK